MSRRPNSIYYFPLDFSTWTTEIHQELVNVHLKNRVREIHRYSRVARKQTWPQQKMSILRTSKKKDNKSSASSHHSHTTVQSGICCMGPNSRSEQLLSCSKVLLHAVLAAQCQPKQFVYEHFASVVQWATWGWWEFYSSPHTLSPSLYIHFPLATHFHIFPSKLPFPSLFSLAVI